ncbi:MAG: Dabb family protein [Puniceicoccaceae bacterium]|nr:MAG: Dabb family protein [Puniceicoccaceae bacterium]
MLVHNVFFYLRKNLDGPEITEFRMGLESLKSIEHVEAVYIGSPAPVAERPALVANYDFCLTVLLKDVSAHDAYQLDPLHQAFLQTHKEKWKKVRVYDAG